MTDKHRDLPAGRSRAFQVALEAVEEMGRMAEAKVGAGAPKAKKAGKARASKGRRTEADEDPTHERPEPDPAAAMLAARSVAQL